MYFLHILVHLSLAWIIFTKEHLLIELIISCFDTHNTHCIIDQLKRCAVVLCISLQTLRLFALCFLVKFGLTVCTFLTCFGLMLHSFCLDINHQDEDLCHPASLLMYVEVNAMCVDCL